MHILDAIGVPYKTEIYTAFSICIFPESGRYAINKSTLSHFRTVTFDNSEPFESGLLKVLMLFLCFCALRIKKCTISPIIKSTDFNYLVLLVCVMDNMYADIRMNR